MRSECASALKFWRRSWGGSKRPAGGAAVLYISTLKEQIGAYIISLFPHCSLSSHSSAHLGIHHSWRSLLAEKGAHSNDSTWREKEEAARRGPMRRRQPQRSSSKITTGWCSEEVSQRGETFRVSPHFIQLVQFNHAEEKTFWCLI